MYVLKSIQEDNAYIQGFPGKKRETLDPSSNNESVTEIEGESKINAKEANLSATMFFFWSKW